MEHRAPATNTLTPRRPASRRSDPLTSLLRRALRRPYLGCGFVFLVSLAGLVIAARALWAHPVDLEVYRAAGQAVLDGTPLYDGPLVNGLFFVYTPLSALLFVPFAELSMGVTQVVMVLVNCLVLGFCVWRSWRSTSLRGGYTVAVLTLLVACGALTFEPIHATVCIGQINLVLLAVVLWDLLRGDEHRSKGVGVGLAAGIKLTPLLFVLYLLVTRRFRQAGVAAGTFLCTVVLGFATLPADSVKFWLTGVFADSTRIWPDAGASQNTSLNGLLIRLGGHPVDTKVLWLGLAGALVVCTGMLAVRASRRGDELLAVTLFGLCAAAISPWSWGHHWVWLVPLAVFVGNQVLRSTGRRHVLVWSVPAMLVALAFLPALVVPPPGQGNLDPADPLAWAVGNMYLLVFGVVLVAGALHLRYPASSPPTTSGPSAGRRDERFTDDPEPLMSPVG